MKLSFQMPAKDVNIMVVFSADFSPVEVTSSEGGTASYPDFLAEYNSTVYITIEPDEGYELDYITVNGERIDGTSFTMPDNTAQVYVAFKKITYAVEVVSGPNGTASVAEDHACWGDEVTVLVTPDEGYILDTVKVNGEAILGRRFTMPVEDVVIEVTFKEKDTTRNGWILEDGRYYYFRDGDMVTGWVRSGSWYYLDPDNYYMVTGWNQIEGSTYYFTESGSMVTGWKQIAGAWYYFENSGAMAKNWKKLGNKWYYLERDSGAMLTGWYTDGDKEYYLASDGAMTTGWKKIDDSWYYFTESGALTKGWKSIGGKWYFLDSEGKMVTGLMRDGSVWYYFESSGAMATGWKKIDGDWFYFESSGAMKTGWLKSGSDWYYLETYGVMVTGWKQIDGSWYYFYDNGIMAYDTTINGYELGSNGKMK
jgi:glucan-binding YG repeat protein